MMKFSEETLKVKTQPQYRTGHQCRPVVKNSGVSRAISTSFAKYRQ